MASQGDTKRSPHALRWRRLVLLGGLHDLLQRQQCALPRPVALPLMPRPVQCITCLLPHHIGCMVSPSPEELCLMSALRCTSNTCKSLTSTQDKLSTSRDKEEAGAAAGKGIDM